MTKMWMNKDDYDLDQAWSTWKNSKVGVPIEYHEEGYFYDEYIKVLNRIKNKKEPITAGTWDYGQSNK